MRYPLDQKISKIREFINIISPRKGHALRQDTALWYMLCSCMDIISDMEHALESFLKEDPDTHEIGRKYLLVFGALQALYVQQDAINNLHQALDIPYTLDPSIDKIRTIRNDAAGHPTNRRNKKAFNFINRSALGVHEFQLMTLDPTNSKSGSSNFTDVNVVDLIITQRNVFLDILNNVIETLKEEVVEHRKEFADKKLYDTLSDTVYRFEKIFEAVYSKHPFHSKSVGSYVDRIQECVEAFKDGLKDRGEPDDNLSELYENLDYMLKHIKAFFEKEQKTHIQRKDAYIFACYASELMNELNELMDTARKLDEEYNQ